MKIDRQLQQATETSWVVSYGGKTIPRWRTTAILKIDIATSQWKIIGFSWKFVYSGRFWTGWTSRVQKWKSCIGQTLSSTKHICCLTQVLTYCCPVKFFKVIWNYTDKFRLGICCRPKSFTVAPGWLLAYRALIFNFLLTSTCTRWHFKVMNEQLCTPTVFIVSAMFRLYRPSHWRCRVAPNVNVLIVADWRVDVCGMTSYR